MSTTISQHPDSATLVSYAAGSLAEPLAAVVAAHAAMCPQCSVELADLDIIGAAILLGGPPTAARVTSIPLSLPPDAPGRDDKRTLDRSAIVRPERLPAPIALAYGLSFASIPWKRLGPGVWHHRLALSKAAKGDLRLLKIGPDRRMPDHGHGGGELTLVLDGAFRDVTGRYGIGDVQDVGESVEHTPHADRTTGCICLIASERPARFKGLLSRLLQPLTGM
jgi:putative transcriptional regulator